MELLRDLKALGQIRVIIVLSVKAYERVDLAVQCRGRFDGQTDRFLVHARQAAGMTEVDLVDACIGYFSKGHRGPGEHLGLCLQLAVDLDSDDCLVIHAFTSTVLSASPLSSSIALPMLNIVTSSNGRQVMFTAIGRPSKKPLGSVMLG